MFTKNKNWSRKFMFTKKKKMFTKNFFIFLFISFGHQICGQRLCEQNGHILDLILMVTFFREQLFTFSTRPQ